MLVAHLVILTWNEGVTAEQVAQLDHELDELAGKVPVLVSYLHGANLHLRDPGADYGICAIVEDSNLNAYLDHPEHRAVLGGALGAMVAKRAAAQISIARPLAELLATGLVRP